MAFVFQRLLPTQGLRGVRRPLSLAPISAAQLPIPITAAITPYSHDYGAGQVRGLASKRFKHKKIIKLAKGYTGPKVYKIQVNKVEKAMQHAYRDRKNKKRDFRRLWIQRINAGVMQYGVRYAHFINQAMKANVTLNRKVLAEMAVTEPYSFRAVVETVKAKGGRIQEYEAAAAEAELANAAQEDVMYSDDEGEDEEWIDSDDEKKDEEWDPSKPMPFPKQPFKKFKVEFIPK